MSVVLACGLGRCGSSLTMQMLQAGGMKVLGDYPAFEPEAVSIGCDMRTLLPRIDGMAAKILDPHRAHWPDSLDAVKVIWLDRDRRQQAKSQVKMLQQMGGFAVPSQAWRGMAASLISDRALCLKVLLDRGAHVSFFRFENILADPKREAVRMNQFVGGLDADAMAKQVLPRDPRCRPDLSIEISLCEEAMGQ